jgi:hypothetical protein
MDEFKAYLETEIQKRFEEGTEKEKNLWWKKNADTAVNWVNDNHKTALELGAHEDDSAKHKADYLLDKLGIKKFESYIKQSPIQRNREGFKIAPKNYKGALAGLSDKNEDIVNDIEAYLKNNKSKYQLPEKADYYRLGIGIYDLERGKQNVSLEGYSKEKDFFIEVPAKLARPVIEDIQKKFAKYNLIYRGRTIIFPDQTNGGIPGK